VIDSVADEGWGNRFSGRIQKILSRLRDADTGVSCHEQNFPGESADEEDQITVFDADNMCKLNGQVNAAIIATPETTLATVEEKSTAKLFDLHERSRASLTSRMTAKFFVIYFLQIKRALIMLIINLEIK